GVHRSHKFCLLTMTGPDRPARRNAEFVFFALNVAHLAEPGRRFTLSAEDIARLSPNTRTCPTFRSHRDAELAKTAYSHAPVLLDEEHNNNVWNVVYSQGLFHSSNDSSLFVTDDDLESGTPLDSGQIELGNTIYLPLYEGR